VDAEGVKEYAVEITRVNPQSEPAPKSMVIHVTDERLLEKTGGIVQGMSGSPILQDGRIVGAVTHVFVSDPTQGYGLYVDWMLQESGAV
jgi:stage IV sporulation protein B